MKNNLLLLAVMLLLASCNLDKRYSYVITEMRSYGENDRDPEIITAQNDSLAYLEAFQAFCIAVKVHKEMIKQGYDSSPEPLCFTLYNDKGEKILPHIESETLSELENKIMAFKSSISEPVSTPTSKIDTATVEKLSPLFKFKKDEFDPRELTWISPKSAPQYTNMNGIYCYFMKDINGVSNFRFRIQYYGEDWLFIRKYQFSIDGKAYEFIPANVERDSGYGGKIWEWCDENISIGSDIEIVKALSEAKTAKIKFVGSQYHDIRTITKKELKSIKNAIDLYTAMGGEL